jgi:hypothetical protein
MAVTDCYVTDRLVLENEYDIDGRDHTVDVG